MPGVGRVGMARSVCQSVRVVSDAYAASIADELWLLTTCAEPRRAPPHAVRLGVVTAAICDLANSGEVSWTGPGNESYLLVRETCHCVDDTERRWHERLVDAAGGRALAARFCVGPLIPDTWDDVAQRLITRHAADEVGSRLTVWGRPTYRVADRPAVERRQHQLRRDLKSGLVPGRDHDLIVIAWASGCLDDLFQVHGLAVGGDVTDAARQVADGDELAQHLETAVAYSASLPMPPMM